MPGKSFRFYPIDVSYKVIDGNPIIFMFGKTEEGKKICVLDQNFKPYFLVLPKKDSNIDTLKKELLNIKTEEKDFIAKVEKIEEIKKNLLGKEKLFLKIYTKIPRGVPKLVEKIKEKEIVDSAYEYDIQFVRRYLIDNEIVPFSSVEVKGSIGTTRAKVPVIIAEKIEKSTEDTLDNINILGFDIETYNPEGKVINPEKYPIIMIAVYAKNYRRCITWKRFNTENKNIHFVNSEADLIEAFKNILEEIRPDVITGYFSDGFDLPYIFERAKKYKVKLDLGLDYSELDIKRRKNKSGIITGMPHLDMHAYIKNIFGRSLDFDSYSLNEVSQKLMEEEKIDVDMDHLFDAWDNHPEKLEEYCEYNIQDSRLVYMLCEKLLPNIIELVKMIGINAYDVSRMGMSQIVEWYLIRNAHDKNEAILNKPDYKETKKRLQKSYEGGFVYEPTPGLYKDIIIFDYRSLYPSIISAHNISPETLYCSCCKEETEMIPKGEGSNYWFCKKKAGFIPTIINDLITRRIRIKRMIEGGKKNPFLAAKQQNFKLLANSFYGYLGFFAARWYSIESAKAVTAYGRSYILDVIDKAKKAGFEILYSDTDSVFILLGERSEDDAKKFIEKINMDLPEQMELEYEGFYPSGIFVKAKASESGAKKRYALLGEDGNITIKGFETVRRNWSQIGKDVQKTVLEILLKEHDKKKALEYVKEIIKKTRDHNIEKDKFLIRTQIQKKTSEYDTIGPHVKAAMIMESKGYSVVPGTVISYIVTKGEGTIRERVMLPEDVDKGMYDSEYYINNQIIPAVERLLNIFGYTKEDLAEEKSQSKLDGFF